MAIGIKMIEHYQHIVRDRMVDKRKALIEQAVEDLKARPTAGLNILLTKRNRYDRLEDERKAIQQQFEGALPEISRYHVPTREEILEAVACKRVAAQLAGIVNYQKRIHDEIALSGCPEDIIKLIREL